MRRHMTYYCESNSLHLALIFHDWDVEPDQLDYLGLRHAIASASQQGTHSLLLGDLDFIREPSKVLTTLAEAVLQSMPDLNVQCFVDSRAFEELN